MSKIPIFVIRGLWALFGPSQVIAMKSKAQKQRTNFFLCSLEIISTDITVRVRLMTTLILRTFCDFFLYFFLR